MPPDAAGEAHVVEAGFSRADVCAVCDVGASTKQLSKQRRAVTGHKGIGFKSCFMVSDRPCVVSGAFSFRFDMQVRAGQTTPATVCRAVGSTGSAAFGRVMQQQ